MKSRFLTLLLIGLLLACLPVLAGAQSMTARDGDDLYYVGQRNYVYLRGEGEPVLEEAAASLVCAENGLLIYTTKTSGTTTLKRFSLGSSGRGRIITRIEGDAVWSARDGLVYFVTRQNPDTLSTFDPQSLETDDACKASGDITELRVSIGGLLVRTEYNEKLYIPALKRLATPHNDLSEQRILAVGDAQAQLDEAQNLTFWTSGSGGHVRVDEDVSDMATNGAVLFYLKNEYDSYVLMAYMPDTGTAVTLDSFDIAGNLLADGSFIYLMDESGNLYRYDIGEGESTILTNLWDEGIETPLIETADGLLLIYDQSGSKPSYVTDFEIEDWDRPWDAPTPRPTPTVRPRPTPRPTPKRETEADFYTLSIGMRGEAVSRLQDKLSDLGYLSAGSDGVFGTKTQTAIKYLQGDMGYTETGSASAQLQYKLYYGNPPEYEPYLPLSYGDSGIRVSDMQTRLRELYYTKAPAGGHYQAQTEEAVERFQSEVGYSQTGRITAGQLKRLFSNRAPEFSGYLDLEKGDAAPAVKRLNQRLKRLGYLKGSAGSSYNKRTYDAVFLFQSYNGLRADGVATAELQENMIFSPDANPYVPEPTPIPTPEPVRVITAGQLKTIRLWMNKNLKKNFNNPATVEHLQKRLKKVGAMDEGEEITKVYDQTTYDAVWTFQEQEGLAPTGVADKETLKALFP